MFACQETASFMIAKELCDRGQLAEATHGCPVARRVEYSTETADISIVHPSRVSTSKKPADSGAGRFETTGIPHNRHPNVIKDSQNTHPEMHTKLKEIEELSNSGGKVDTGKLDE